MQRIDDYFSVGRDAQSVTYIVARNEVLVVALTDAGEALLAVEPAPAFGEEARVLPGGTAVPEEAHDATANRELQEEVGYRAGRLDFLGELRPWPKYLTVRSYVYLARELTESRLEGDEGYEIGVERVPLDGFEAWIADGRLRDARAIAALYLARAFLAAEKGPQPG